MTIRFGRLLAAGALALAILSSPALGADSVVGRWDATLTIGGAAIPFRLDVVESGQGIKGVLYNGDQPEPTSSASRQGDAVELNYEHYLTRIAATLANGTLSGTVQGRFEAEQYLGTYPFQATRHVNNPVTAASVPSIAGTWEVPYNSPKGEKAWRFVVQQRGAEVSAAILRVDGDTGALTGRFENGRFALSHFDGSRPLALEVRANDDGTLTLQQAGSYAVKAPLVAYRPEVARAKGLPAPADYTAHTTMRDAQEVFTFAFPDVNGKVVSNDDPRFKGKVVLAIVTGTWCPNCHDEAQYLVQLYKKYRDQGLEIVALDFEEPEQQDDLARVHAFTKQYGIDYTYLIAGAPSEMWEKVPQAVNLNTWPATFFIGRDGRVKLIHAGFAAPASGVFHDQLKQEFTSTIERLLADRPVSQGTSGN